MWCLDYAQRLNGQVINWVRGGVFKSFKEACEEAERRGYVFNRANVLDKMQSNGVMIYEGTWSELEQDFI